MTSNIRADDPNFYERLEALVARGAASFVVTRLLLQAGFSWVFSIPFIAIAAAVLYFMPVAAVESMMAASILVLCGAAKYWPINFFVLVLGAIGVGGLMNACLQWSEFIEPALARRKRKTTRQSRVTKSRAIRPRNPDNEAALIVLVIGSLFASLIGALP